MAEILNEINRKVRILLIEDSESVQVGYRRALEDIASLFPATNLIDARRELEGAVAAKKRGLPGFDFVVVDACIPVTSGEEVIDTPNTTSLVTEFRSKLGTVPFIAASSEPTFNDQLVAAGCGYISNKNDLRAVIVRLVA
ncbi:MAG: hypothetical protein A2408_01620 [Candidatus Yonathbacteria bacterium RIFOXYC1_FULL_52_10]|uniref:Response regulatory domain-containing protein n=1 Tax=Candidatus Yonathbacteria bacterium RIFOXYD1_FULL_52_36 TaxID=1802730 RepID=A0A1G2SM86_9BACT|nr:MAG: hypothetical protein A2408_01620 [Candidatus Yonathbacteria bacterium RIFOXYC1_FULL_52_10]OHA85769.1 MAG: hypothetical protein A2591_02790 [Candidatus Yonathbacteria bacterium RIFOXYD1_FULL_52_36]